MTFDQIAQLEEIDPSVLVQLNPVLVEYFGLSNKLPPNTSVFLPPEIVVHPSSLPQQEVKRVEPKKTELQPQNTQRTGDDQQRSFVNPGPQYGHTLSEVAWNLGVPLPQLRLVNQHLKLRTDHEVLPQSVSIRVPREERSADEIDDRSIFQPPSQPSQLTISDRTVFSSLRPLQHRTSVLPFKLPLEFNGRRGGAPPQQHLLLNDSHQFVSPQRSAIPRPLYEQSIATSIQYVTRSLDTVDSIAHQFHVHPDVIYDSNPTELTDRRGGVVYFQEPLDMGLVLFIPY